MCNLFMNVDMHIDFLADYLTLIRQEQCYHKEQKMQVITEMSFVNAKGYFNIIVCLFPVLVLCADDFLGFGILEIGINITLGSHSSWDKWHW